MAWHSSKECYDKVTNVVQNRHKISLLTCDFVCRTAENIKICNVLYLFLPYSMKQRTSRVVVVFSFLSRH